MPLTYEIGTVREYRLHSVEGMPGVYVVTEGDGDQVIKMFQDRSDWEAMNWFTRWVYDDGPMWERIEKGEAEHDR